MLVEYYKLNFNGIFLMAIINAFFHTESKVNFLYKLRSHMKDCLPNEQLL
jgi:hypothetical protein